MIITTISSVVILFLIHHFVIKAKWYNEYFIKKFGPEKGQIRIILFNRILGATLFGAISLFIVIFLFKNNISSIGLVARLNFLVLIAFLIFGIIAFTVNFFAARAPGNLKMYPQIRSKEWNIQLIIVSALSWVIYLTGYEIMFRGFLFSTCLLILGLWPAIAINIALYAITHIPKGYKEAIGAIPMGLILCLVTYFSGSIIAAILIHISLSLSNEWFSIKYNPQITIKK